LYFDVSTLRLVFSIYNTDTSAEVTSFIVYNGVEFNSLIDNWTRVVCVWSKEQGVRLYAGSKFAQSPITFTPYSVSDISEVQIGRRESSYAESLIGHIKINLLEKADDEVLYDISEDPYADQKAHKIFENVNKHLVLDASYLDTGSSFLNDTNYYLWIVNDDFGSDTASLIISQSNVSPLNHNRNLSKVVAGFRTDSSATPLIDSFWDIKSIDNKVIHAERLLIHGKNSSTNSIEFRSIPYGEEDDAQFNVVTRFTDHIYANDGTSDFFDIGPTGYLEIDDIRIDGGTISTKTSDLTIQSSTGSNIVVNTTGLDINSSGAGLVSIDNILIKGNKIYTAGSNHLLIENNQTSTNIAITATGGRVEINSDAIIASSKKLKFGNTVEQKISLRDSDNLQGMGTQSSSVYIRTTGHVPFFKNGIHSSTNLDPGSGGTLLAAITDNVDVSTSIDPNSRFYAGRVYNAVYNDLAECWEKELVTEHPLDYGSVAVQTEHGIEASSKRAQRATIGVVSNSYGFILGSEGFNDKNIALSKKVPIAISGRVRVKINNGAKIGDELVSYKNGFAIKANLFERTFKRGRILGQVDSVPTQNLNTEEFSCMMKVR
jgi:hypothetical protein